MSGLDLVVMLIVASTAIGSLFFFLGYGIMFVSAFGVNKAIGAVLLVLLAFSVVFFVWAGLSPYYVIPIWFLPPIYAQIVYKKTKLFKRAMWWFWIGLVLLLPMAFMILDRVYLGWFFEPMVK